jgi:hypothetical protein
MAHAKYMAIKRAMGPTPEELAKQQQQGGWLGWLRHAAGGAAGAAAGAAAAAAGAAAAAAGGGHKPPPGDVAAAAPAPAAASGGGAHGEVMEADMGVDEWQKLAELAMQSEVGALWVVFLHTGLPLLQRRL